MNDQITELPVVEANEVTLVPTEVKHFIYDEAGNRVEVPEAEVIGYVQEGEGTVATVTE